MERIKSSMRSLKNKLFHEEKSPNTEDKKTYPFREGNSRNKGIQKLKEASNSDKQMR
jgi:hypothetical protein